MHTKYTTHTHWYTHETPSHCYHYTNIGTQGQLGIHTHGTERRVYVCNSSFFEAILVHRHPNCWENLKESVFSWVRFVCTYDPVQSLNMDSLQSPASPMPPSSGEDLQKVHDHCRGGRKGERTWWPSLHNIVREQDHRSACVYVHVHTIMCVH